VGQTYCVKSKKNAKLLPRKRVTAVTKLSGTPGVLSPAPEAKPLQNDDVKVGQVRISSHLYRRFIIINYRFAQAGRALEAAA
jgi:hypothetical protein